MSIQLHSIEKERLHPFDVVPVRYQRIDSVIDVPLKRLHSRGFDVSETGVSGDLLVIKTVRSFQGLRGTGLVGPGLVGPGLWCEKWVFGRQ